MPYYKTFYVVKEDTHPVEQVLSYEVFLLFQVALVPQSFGD